MRVVRRCSGHVKVVELNSTATDSSAAALRMVYFSFVSFESFAGLLSDKIRSLRKRWPTLTETGPGSDRGVERRASCSWSSGIAASQAFLCLRRCQVRVPIDPRPSTAAWPEAEDFVAVETAPQALILRELRDDCFTELLDRCCGRLRRRERRRRSVSASLQADAIPAPSGGAGGQSYVHPTGPIMCRHAPL